MFHDAWLRVEMFWLTMKAVKSVLARVAVVVGVLSGIACAEEANINHGYKSSRPWLPRTPVVTELSAATADISFDDLPKEFDWRDANGLNLVVDDWNQHIPQYCGACWVHGTLSALNDRIKVMRRGKFPDVVLGRQAIINCVPDPNVSLPPPGCAGGDAWMIHKYLHHNKVPDESCMPYQAKNMECSPENVCRNCGPNKKEFETAAGIAGCWAVTGWTGYGVSSYGNISGEEAMMKEIYSRGPIACSYAADLTFLLNYSENVLLNDGVYMTDKLLTKDDIDHVMEVTGWGETASGVKYWVVRNSWGTFWGNAGWLKLKRGDNMLLGESDCDWAVPTFDDLDEVLAGRVMGDYVRGISPVNAAKRVTDVLAGPGYAAATDLAQAQRLHEVGFAANTVACMIFASFAVGVSVTSMSARFVLAPHLRKDQPLLG